MILKAKDGFDVYLADSVIDMAEVISIIHTSYKTTVKFEDSLKKKPLSFVLTKEQHNSFIEQLTDNFIISQTTKTTNAARKLRVVESSQTSCLKEN